LKVKEFYKEKKFDDLLNLINEIKKEEIKIMVSDSDLIVLEKIQNEIYLEKKNYVDAFENVGSFVNPGPGNKVFFLSY
jgi:CRISPR/Cas system CMR subunit Cmr4 (Cas7 group RAMP superfamily)